jgi:hypothetical protein
MAIRNVSKTVSSVENAMCERIDRKNNVPLSVRRQSESTRVFYAGGVSHMDEYKKNKRNLVNSFRL